MPFALRALVMLAATVPLFAATAFHPAWWQTLIAAAIGGALGQLAVRATRGHRIAALAVAVGAAIVAAGAGAWPFVHGALHDGPAAMDFVVVRSTGSLTWEDVRAIETAFPPAAPYLHKSMQLTSEDENWATQVVGTTPTYFDVRSLHVAQGRPFEATDAAPGKVVVLGETVVKQLFAAGTSPVGQQVRIGNTPFTVIGVLAHQGMSPEGQDFDDVALVPIDMYATRLAFDSKVRFGGVVFVKPDAEPAVRGLLRDRHRLAPGDDDDFLVHHPGEVHDK